MDSVLPTLERELFRTFRSKRKFSEGKYAIFLTNQFYKEQFLELIGKRFTNVETVITSGTIKKCKSAIELHRKNRVSLEKEISAFP